VKTNKLYSCRKRVIAREAECRSRLTRWLRRRAFEFGHVSGYVRPLLTLFLLSTMVIGIDSILNAAGPPGTGKGTKERAVTRAPKDITPEEIPLGKGDLYALVVGVSKYHEPRLRLNFSAKDAQDFAKFLESQKQVFRKTHVQLMLDEQATKRDIEKYLFHDLLRAGKDDTVVLFFSGHGVTDPAHPDELYFLTSDADPKYCEATGLKMTGLHFLNRIDTKRVVLIADACHAGGPARITTRSVQDPLEKFMKMFTEATGRVYLASSRPEEKSQEKEELGNGVFTYYLLKGLRGEADADRDGVVTVEEAYDYAYERTKDETGGAQHPQKLFSGSGRFPLSVLGRLEDTVKLDVRFIAQDPRCTNSECIEPQRESTRTCDDPMCGDVDIQNGSILYSGQNYQVGFRPHARSYVYVYQIDSAGNIFKLFPGSSYLDPDERFDNPVEPGKLYWIPKKNGWLVLDKQEGEEKIFVVASRSRNAKLEDLYKHVEEARMDGAEPTRSLNLKAKLTKELERPMGISKSLRRKLTYASSGTPGPEKARSFEEFSHTLESAQLDAVESVQFYHKGRGPGR
jgi:hypothetical protein